MMPEISPIKKLSMSQRKHMTTSPTKEKARAKTT